MFQIDFNLARMDQFKIAVHFLSSPCTSAGLGAAFPIHFSCPYVCVFVCVACTVWKIYTKTKVKQTALNVEIYWIWFYANSVIFVQCNDKPRRHLCGSDNNNNKQDGRGDQNHWEYRWKTEGATTAQRAYQTRSIDHLMHDLELNNTDHNKNNTWIIQCWHNNNDIKLNANHIKQSLRGFAFLCRFSMHACRRCMRKWNYIHCTYCGYTRYEYCMHICISLCISA